MASKIYKHLINSTFDSFFFSSLSFLSLFLSFFSLSLSRSLSLCLSLSRSLPSRLRLRSRCESFLRTNGYLCHQHAVSLPHRPPALSASISEVTSSLPGTPLFTFVALQENLYKITPHQQSNSIQI